MWVHLDFDIPSTPPRFHPPRPSPSPLLCRKRAQGPNGLDYIVRVRADFPAEKSAANVLLTFMLPPWASSVSVETVYILAKEPYLSEKEPYLSTKEPYAPAKLSDKRVFHVYAAFIGLEYVYRNGFYLRAPHIRKEPCALAQEPCIFVKKSHI